MANERLEQIGLALQGFGAGVSGQLPQFQQALAQRQERQQLLSRERVQAAALDARAVSNFLGQNRPDLAMEVLGDRKGAIDQFGDSNSFETDEAISALQSAIASGDPAQLAAVKAEFDDDVAVFTSQGLLPQEERVSALDQARTEKLRAETDQIRGSGGLQALPKKTLEGLSTSSKAKAKEAFVLAGGGKDGIKAMNAQIELDRTTTQRDDVPAILSGSFPNANPEELLQLQSVVDGAKTVESGLKQADKVRAEQRRLVKAATFQDRAVGLLTNILASPELDDVVGSIEGDDSSLFGITVRSDEESNVIADIEEAQSILTSDNMSLMSGVLSESDIKLLMNLSSGALNRKRGESRFRKDAQELLDRLSSTKAVPVGGSAETGSGQVQRLVFDPATGQLVPK